MLKKNYRFDPTDQELLEYLYLKVKESKTDRLLLPPLVDSLIKERDVYSREPWNLQCHHGEFPLRMKETEMYFFSQRTPSSTDPAGQKCVNAKRTVGKFGTWHGNGKKIAVTALTRSGREVTIGSKAFLSFVSKDNGKCHWVMDEYCLHSKNNEFQRTALCRIREIKRSRTEAPPSSSSSSPRQQLDDIAAVEETAPMLSLPSPMASYQPTRRIDPFRGPPQPLFLPAPLPPRRFVTECFDTYMCSGLSTFGGNEFRADREQPTQLPSHTIRQRLRQLAEAAAPGG